MCDLHCRMLGACVCDVCDIFKVRVCVCVCARACVHASVRAVYAAAATAASAAWHVYNVNMIFARSLWCLRRTGGGERGAHEVKVVVCNDVRVRARLRALCV